jgi:hypothetical protein
MTLVTAKNRCKGMRSVPWKKKRPTATARAMPSPVPTQTWTPALENSTARRIQFRALAQNHQENEEPDSPSGGTRGFPGVGFDAVLDFLAEGARDAVHPNDHGHDERGREQHHEALEAILANAQALEQNGGGDAAGRSSSDAGPGIAREGAAAGSVQINEYNANYEQEGREHGSGGRHFEVVFQLQLTFN